jgi:hypothetical protein
MSFIVIVGSVQVVEKVLLNATVITGTVAGVIIGLADAPLPAPFG